MISLKSTKTQQDSKVNVTSVNNIHIDPLRVSGAERLGRETENGEVKVKYEPHETLLGSATRSVDDSNPYTTLSISQLESKAKSLEALCEVQKCVIQMMMDNPLRVKDYIVADDVVLEKFITLLTDAERVEIEAEDFAQGCFTTHLYRKITDIYAIKGNGEIVENVKYSRPDVMKTLHDLKISTKFVY